MKSVLKLAIKVLASMPLGGYRVYIISILMVIASVAYLVFTHDIAGAAYGIFSGLAFFYTRESITNMNDTIRFLGVVAESAQQSKIVSTEVGVAITEAVHDLEVDTSNG